MSNPNNKKKIYFASDFHLGVGDSKERERKLVRWLDSIAKDAGHVYLVGDVFDFWFEYRYTVPKGFVRLLGKLAELSDNGTEITIFTGNHDMWMKNYLEEEIGATILRQPIEVTYHGKAVLIGHGDGLGPGDHGYKLLKRVFSNPLCQWLYARLHPNFSFWLANLFSSLSRDHTEERTFLGVDKEWLAIYSEEYLREANPNIDYFIFGHRHLRIDQLLSNDKSRYINLGDWITFFSYAVIHESGELELLKFEE